MIKSIVLSMILLLALTACTTPSTDLAECIDGFISVDGTCVPEETPESDMTSDDSSMEDDVMTDDSMEDGSMEEVDDSMNDMEDTSDSMEEIDDSVEETEDSMEDGSMEETDSMEDLESSDVIEGAMPDNGDEVDKTIGAVEGDLVVLKPKAVDPDGDEITYTFSEPFNDDGEWQTGVGDAGEYLVEVTASDGDLEARAQVLVTVAMANQAPTVDCPEEVVFDEGELIFIGCDIEDPDGDEVVVTYSGWMDVGRYVSTYDDAGTHRVRVRAKDDFHDPVERMVTVIVNDVNRKPVIIMLDDLEVIEGDLVDVDPEVSDPDGDSLTIEFSDPLDEEGQWQTERGDAGIYTITVTASDGDLESMEDFVLTVLSGNALPSIDGFEDITVSEGDTVTLTPTITDEDGDDLTVEYSGWMTSTSREVGYDDAGEYRVTVTVGDGEAEETKTITIVVENTNRAPVFIIPA